MSLFNTKIKSAQKGGPGEENYPIRTRTQDLSIVSPSLYHWAIPHFISVSTSELLNLAVSAHLVCHFTFICTYLIWAVAASDCAPTRGLLWSRACDRDGGDARQRGSADPWWESSSQSARHFAVGVTRAFRVLLVSSCSQDELWFSVGARILCCMVFCVCWGSCVSVHVWMRGGGGGGGAYWSDVMTC